MRDRKDNMNERHIKAKDHKLDADVGAQKDAIFDAQRDKSSESIGTMASMNGRNNFYW